jgi:predicted alpha/beta-hydrolase family hydrolase
MVAPEYRSQIDVGGTAVDVAWIVPRGAPAAVVAAHGAGAGMDHPFMVGFARELGAQKIASVRFNFPYLQRGRRSPDPEPTLRAAWLAAFDAARKRFEVPVLASGKSLGGRIASMCVADGMPAAGLIFLGYPLHPPGKRERIRDEHLYRITVPMLFLEGTRDPFAEPELLSKVLRKLGDRAELHEIEGGDHSFNVRGVKRDAREVGAELATIAAPFVERVAKGP